MITFDNIKSYSTDFPDSLSFLWSPEEANAIPQEHKDQIFFLNKEASEFIRNYIFSSKMITGPLWKPFNERYFKTVEDFEVTEDCGKEIKKWLYSKPIPFNRLVYIEGDRSEQSIALTWKMVIKYWEGLFFADDLIVFDETLNWGLFYFHEDFLYFGSDKIYDKEFEYEKTIAVTELKKRFFNRDNLDFNNDDKKKSIRDFKEKYDTNKLD
ncbi:hypothetical protein NAT51_19060 [Flavobacterium amniphilum]|uniref:hypothetical protein n=1 Tax=Flavobacterium amniphilum TaxID=1834035 RepID=UPI00202A3B54|nr:hypothetical protein [Flavobacterium amniphilum]MCL9807630.1 hypothetical protein [Flavobacterium amniphilum]